MSKLKLQFSDLVFYACTFIAAVILAMDTGIKGSPALAAQYSEMTSSSAWGYAPLLLMLLAAVVLVLRVSGLLPPRKGEPNADGWSESYMPKLVDGKDFINSVVLLDGFSYVRCTFTNCTIKYNGTTPPHVSECRFIGSCLHTSDTPAVMATMLLFQGLGVTRAGVEIHGMSGSGARVSRPTESGSNPY